MKYTILLLICLFAFLKSNGKTLNIGGKSNIKSIKAALQIATNGDTLIVWYGIYREGNIVIDKRIYLKGVGCPILDGEKKCEIISIKANGTIVEGFKLVHSGRSSIEDHAGIKVYNCNGVIIRNNILEDTYFGIYIQFGKNCTIEHNKLSANLIDEQQSGNGIHCWKSTTILINGNTVTGHRDGIYLEFVTHSIIQKNTTTGNIRYGLHFMFSNDDIYYLNHFINNGAGVAVMYSHKVKMLYNSFEENWGDAAYGLLLKEISDSEIKENLFKKNTIGIYMEGASRIALHKNSFQNNGWAMKIQASCMNIHVEQNNFLSNTFDVGTNGSLVLNKFENNYWDKYTGYDLNKDKIGDVPYRPLSLFSMIIEKYPVTMILFRSFITELLDKTEKIIPSITPENLIDHSPLMKKIDL